MELKQQILSELSEIEAAIARLQGSETASKKQTDLEIAILREQVSKMHESRANAATKIDKALGILRVLK